jgi:succinoglycan biosynthesis protein ExoM
MLVDVCICTYRRPQIAATLNSFVSQKLQPGWQMRITVVDNDLEPSARTTVLQAAAEHGLDVRYIHAPGRNISIARNACLDSASGDWIAFVDDDEVVSTGWLAAFIEEAAGADVIFGPVQAIYQDCMPNWLRAGDFHSARLSKRKGFIESGYAGNVFIRRNAVEAANIRFDPAYGVSGGEDTVFFGRLAAAGLRLAVAPEAIAFESVPCQRATLKWLARRFFRAGQTHAAMRLAIRGRSNSFLRAGLAAAKASVCVIITGATAWSAHGWRRWFLRALLHSGMALRFMGVRTVA